MPDTKQMLPADLPMLPIGLFRRGLNFLVSAAAVGAVVLVLLPLAAVFGYLIYKGIGSINWAFLTQTRSHRAKPAAVWRMRLPDPSTFC